MHLHFDKEAVDRILEHSRNAETNNSLYGEPDTERAGLWIVGDEGVYLMSNGSPHLPRDENDPDNPRSFVCYAGATPKLSSLTSGGTTSVVRSAVTMEPSSLKPRRSIR